MKVWFGAITKILTALILILLYIGSKTEGEGALAPLLVLFMIGPVYLMSACLWGYAVWKERKEHEHKV